MILGSSRCPTYQAHPANFCWRIAPNPLSIRVNPNDGDSSFNALLLCARPESVGYVSLSPIIARNRRRFNGSLTNCHKNSAHDLFDEFSVLSSDIPWEAGNIWSTMAAYFFSLHIPLSFGGLSVISLILHQPVLDPLTELQLFHLEPMQVTSILLFQTVEFMGGLALFHYTAKPNYSLLSGFFQHHFTLGQRDSIKASVVALVMLFLLVILTSFFADILVGPKDVNNAILKEIISSSTAGKVACFFLYCAVTPLVEETVYRGFLLSSLASTMTWQQSVIISSFVFSLAHLSWENSVQLFLIGCVLGSVYCWTGNIAASITVHSVYNAAILLITIVS